MKNKGITLIALVITIIVLLILAGVSIATLTGENGILTQAQQAKETTKAENDMEIIKMAWTTEGMAYLSDTYPDTGEDVFLEELKKTDENATVEYTDDYYYGITDEIYIYYNDDNYILNGRTMEIVQEEKLTPEQLEERAMEMVVATTDKIVVLPISIEYNCTIDWGDGCTTTNEGKTATKEEVKVASNENIIKLALAGATHEGIGHQYEKDGEYTVKIKGQRIYDINWCRYYNPSDGKTYESPSNLLEIKKWGETGLRGIDLYSYDRLAKIASPEENSFKDLIDCRFRECRALTEIPSDLFKNAPKIEDLNFVFYGCTALTKIPSDLFKDAPQINDFWCAFAGCTGLTGTAPEIWKLGTNNKDNGYAGTPNGYRCFNDCTRLENYDDIPNYWK